MILDFAGASMKTSKGYYALPTEEFGPFCHFLVFARSYDLYDSEHLKQ